MMGFMERCQRNLLSNLALAVSPTCFPGLYVYEGLYSQQTMKETQWVSNPCSCSSGVLVCLFLMSGTGTRTQGQGLWAVTELDPQFCVLALNQSAYGSVLFAQLQEFRDFHCFPRSRTWKTRGGFHKAGGAQPAPRRCDLLPGCPVIFIRRGTAWTKELTWEIIFPCLTP